MFCSWFLLAVKDFYFRPLVCYELILCRLREVDMASFLHMWGSIAMLSPLLEVWYLRLFLLGIFWAAKGLVCLYEILIFSPLFEKNVIEFWWELSGLCRSLLEQGPFLLQVFSLAFPFVWNHLIPWLSCLLPLYLLGLHNHITVFTHPTELQHSTPLLLSILSHDIHVR